MCGISLDWFRREGLGQCDLAINKASMKGGAIGGVEMGPDVLFEVRTANGRMFLRRNGLFERGILGEMMRRHRGRFLERSCRLVDFLVFLGLAGLVDRREHSLGV